MLSVIFHVDVEIEADGSRTDSSWTEVLPIGADLQPSWLEITYEDGSVQTIGEVADAERHGRDSVLRGDGQPTAVDLPVSAPRETTP